MSTTPACLDPSACHICGRHAIGIGLEPASKGQQPRWLCAECLPLVEYVKSIRRFDAYEIKASEMAGDIAGALLDGWAQSDLGLLSQEQWAVFCRTMCQAFGDSMRHLIRSGEAPF